MSKLLLAGVFVVLGFSVPFLAADKKHHHHHHNHGVHLSVVIDCQHPAIRNSNDAPEWVLVQHAEKLGLNIEVKSSQPVKGKSNLLKVEVATPIPIEASIEVLDYVAGLYKIEFVVDVSILQKEGSQ